MLKFVTVMVALGFIAVPAAHANISQYLSGKACTNYITQANVNVPGCGGKEKGLDQPGGLATKIVDTFLYIAGIVAFIFILLGGFRYITATGDPTRIQAAKDTLLYSIIGLIITFLAIPAAGFVIKTVAG